jgi:hypothetical protein
MSQFPEKREIVDQIIAVSRDITKKKEKEQRLQLLTSVITNTHDAVVITEEPLTILDQNYLCK